MPVLVTTSTIDEPTRPCTGVTPVASMRAMSPCDHSPIRAGVMFGIKPTPSGSGAPAKRVAGFIAPETVSGVLDCEKVGEVVACGEPPNPFTDAVTEATAQLGRAAAALDKEPLPEAFTRLFGGSEETAATMRANLLLLSEHLTKARGPERHACHNECDAQCTSATAYNAGHGEDARMTGLARWFAENLKRVAA